MPLPIPRLDDRTYADLMAEALALIPTLAPKWTNHNPSDPGITLLELLAWRTEMLIYRTDQVPAEHRRAFLALLNGPEAPAWADQPLDEQVRRTVLALRDEYRAVTGGDFERLVTGPHFREWLEGWTAREEETAAVGSAPLAGWWETTGLPAGQAGRPSALPAVARAHCFPRRDLTRPGAPEALAGHVSVVVVPRGVPEPGAEAALCRAVHAFLDERRLLGTWHHVVPPVRLPLRVRVVAALRSDVPVIHLSSHEAQVLAASVPADGEVDADSLPREAAHAAGLADWLTRWQHVSPDPRLPVVRQLARWLDPEHGGDEGTGWELGRSVFVSELYAELEHLPIIDYVPLILLEGPDGPLGDRGIWNDDGQLVGVALETRELPRLQLSPADVHLAQEFVPVTVKIQLRSPRTGYSGAALGGLRMAARLAFPPLRPATGGDPAAPGSVEVGLAELRADLLARSGLAEEELVSVEVVANPSRVVRGRSGAPVAVRFRAGEMAAVNVDLVEPRSGGSA